MGNVINGRCIILRLTRKRVDNGLTLYQGSLPGVNPSRDNGRRRPAAHPDTTGRTTIIDS